MAIKELTDEQVRTWTLEQKDKWWLENVYRGDMPQLTIRSALTGMALGGILCLTNLYVGIKTGWTLGVGITSVILSFAIFKGLSRIGMGKEMSLLENNAMQSIATSAGYMTAPLISSISAYMLVTQKVVPQWQVIPWIIVLGILGVLFAFPLKRKYINDDQLKFPEGYAAGVVLDNLHGSAGKEALFKAKILGLGAALSALIEVWRNHAIMGVMKLQAIALPEAWDDLIYKFWTPTIHGSPLNKLTIQMDSSIVLFGTGGLLNLRTGASMILGGALNYAIIAPILVRDGIIASAGYRPINMWSVWGGVAIMTTASLYSFFAKPDIILSAFAMLKKKKGAKAAHALDHIELPMKVSLIGIPIVGLITIWMGHVFFDIHWLMGLIAIPLVFAFSLIAVNSTGLTAITPGSALAKLTQLSYSVLSPGNITTNIMSAGICSEVSLNTSNLLMDIKPAYMLGGKPRHQAIGHVLGIFVGAFVAVPVFYLIFNGNISLLTSEKLPLPGAMTWRAVAEVLTKGLDLLHPSAKWAVMIGAFSGILFEFLDRRMKGRFPLSAMGIGLGFILPFKDSFSMGMGAIVFWALSRHYDKKKKKGTGFKVFTENQETTSAGIIAGGSIIGIILVIIETVFLAS